MCIRDRCYESRPCGEPESCNYRDDDCDGLVDDGEDCGFGCTAFTFWDSVHYACTDALNWSEARAECMSAMRADLSTLNSETERTVLGAATVESWVGLRQMDGASAANVGWSWLDATSTFALGFARPPWDGGSGGQPDDDTAPENNQQNCGSLRDDSDLEDDDCTDNHDFVCERAWRY